MRPLRTRLQEAWREPGLQSYVVERDYLLSWVLAGISEVPELRETLAFKGETALKKCYFGDYRWLRGPNRKCITALGARCHFNGSR